MAVLTRILAAALLACAMPAQEPAPPPAEVETRTLEETVALLQDEQAREDLVRRLQALIAARRAAEPPPKSGPLAGLAALFADISGRIGDAAVTLVDQVRGIPDRLAELGELLGEPERRDRLVAATLRVAASVFAALAAFLAIAILLRRPVARLMTDAGARPDPWRLTLRLGLRLLPILPQLGVGFAVASLLVRYEGARAVAGALLFAMALHRAATAVIELLVDRNGPQFRLLPVTDEHAAALGRRLRRIAATAIWGGALLASARALAAGPELQGTLANLYGLVLLVLGIWLVLAERGPVREGLQGWLAQEPVEGGRPSRVRHVIAAVAGFWWPLAILYLLGVYTVWAGGVPGGLGFVLRATLWSVLAIAAGLVAGLLLRWLLRRLRHWAERASVRLPGLADELAPYFTGVRIVLDLAITVLVAGFVLQSWGAGGLELLGSEPMRALAAAAADVLLILLLAAVTIDVATVLARRALERRQYQGRGNNRMRTLIPLARVAIQVTVSVIAGIMILGALGIEIGPLLAGVGIVGLALGFGAQTLVKDLITGAFLLMEDALAVGDICNIEGTGGVVEAISLRSVRLRDLQGVVHTIPFSSVNRVSNLTMDYSCWLVEAGVAYHEDVDQVIDVLRRLGDELRQDPVFGPEMLEPIEIIGLDRFEDSAVIVRARFKTRAASQWKVGREFNRRMKREFDRIGIEIPFPYRTIVFQNPEQAQLPKT